MRLEQQHHVKVAVDSCIRILQPFSAFTLLHGAKLIYFLPNYLSLFYLGSDRADIYCETG